MIEQIFEILQGQIGDIIKQALAFLLTPSQGQKARHALLEGVWKGFCLYVFFRPFILEIAEFLNEATYVGVWVEKGNQEIDIRIIAIVLRIIIFSASCIVTYLFSCMFVSDKFPFFSIFFEYHTYYNREFLKECYKPVRTILKLYFDILCFSGFLNILFRKPREVEVFFDWIISAFVVYSIYSMFLEDTKAEYVEKMSEIPQNMTRNRIKDYVGLVQESRNPKWVLKAMIESNRLPEIQNKPVFADEYDYAGFLYKNANNLDHLELMKCLLEEKSVLTDTPFYKDMGVALFLPLHEALRKGKKIIFFIGGSETHKEIMDWIEEGISDVTKMEEFWKITNLSEQERSWDIGVMTSDDMTMLYGLEKLLTNPDGFVVVFIHPEKLLMEAQNELYEWGYLLSLQQTAPIYVVIERAMLGLLDLVSHLFCTEFTHVSKATEPACVTSLYVVDGEQRELYEEKIKITPYIGMEGVLAKYANDADMIDVHWMTGNKAAFEDVNSIKKQHMLFGTDDKILCKTGLWGLRKTGTSFQILTDEFNNIWELARQAKTRGEVSAIISIASDKYLLLPYMLDQFDTFRDDIYAIPAMASDFSEVALNRSIVLMKLLLYRNMSGEEIRRYRSRYGNKSGKDEKLYDGSVLKRKERKEIEDEMKECLGSSLDICIKQKKNIYYIVKSPSLLRKCEELTAPAVYFDEEEKIKTLLSGKHLWQIDQIYLPGQIAALNGKLYQIKGKEKLYTEHKWEEVLRVKRYRGGMIYGQRYYQDRLYLFEKEMEIGNYLEARCQVKWKMLSLPFSVETKGYYTMARRDNEDRLEYEELSKLLRERIRREYMVPCKRKNVIALQFEENSEWSTRRTMAIIFSEVLKTLFPEGHPYIAVLPRAKETIEPNAEKPYEHLYYRMKENGIQGSYDILIAEDSQLELGILSMINRHMEHILRIIYSYCKWWQDTGDENNKNKDNCIIKRGYWEQAMETMEGFVSELDAAGFETLSANRNKNTGTQVNQMAVKTGNYCRCCWREVPIHGGKCDICKNASLTEESYKTMIQVIYSQFTIMFGMQINFPIEIVEKRRFQWHAVQRSWWEKSRFRCTPHADYYAAMASLVRETVICWIENNLDKADKVKLNDKEEKCVRSKNVKRALGDWYEICFMYLFKQDEYVARRIAALSKKRGDEKTYFEALCNIWKVEDCKKETPLGKYL